MTDTVSTMSIPKMILIHFAGSLQLFTIIVVAALTKTKKLGHVGTGFYMALVAVVLSSIACLIQIIVGCLASRNYAWAKEEKDYWFTGRRSSRLIDSEETPLLRQD